MERSGFFDAYVVGNEYDRVYLAESFARYFASFIGNGVFGARSTELQVRAAADGGMYVTIKPGQGWINGYWYENTDDLTLKIDNADGVLNRIDNVVLRWGLQERAMNLVVKKGTFAVTASAPALVRNAEYYELKLAEVFVRAGAVSIFNSDIKDTRLDTAVCGAVTGVVNQISSEYYGYQLNAFIERYIAKADNEYLTKFIPSLDALKVRAQQALDDFLAYLKTLEKNANDQLAAFLALLTAQRSEATTEINRLLEELRGLLSGDIASALSERLTEVERKTTNETQVASITHNLGEYRHVDLYEYTYGWGIGGAGEGPAGGGSLISVPIFKYEMSNDNTLRIKTSTGYGTVEGTYKVDDGIYAITFKNQITSLIVMMR